jgi:DNA modification methylase
LIKPYYENDHGKLYCGDCLEIMPQLIAEGVKVDAAVTSPPYDGLRNYNGYCFNFEGIARALCGIVKDGGIVVWVVGDSTVDGSESGTSFRQALYFKEVGFRLHDTMIYSKRNYVPLTHNRYEQQFEYMFVLSKGRPATFNPIQTESRWGGTGQTGVYRQDATGRKEHAHTPGKINPTKRIGNVWEYDVGYMKGSPEPLVFEHPATFPEKLAKDHVLSWSNPGDVVLDPFSGSGTTAYAAQALDRRWLACEISPEYCEIAKKRLEGTIRQIEGQASIFEQLGGAK